MAAVEKIPTGLRERQKSRRKRDIMSAAKKLFESDGYDATTMAKIADMAEVSTPTVFNYFGSKDDLIAAIVLDIHEHGRAVLRDWRPQTALTAGELLGEVLCIYADLSMEQAGKRIWRYAEGMNIFNPGSPVFDMFDQIESYHTNELAQLLQDKTGMTDTDCAFLASVAYRCWNTRFHAFVRDDAMTLAAHKTLVRDEMHRLCAMMSL